MPPSPAGGLNRRDAEIAEKDREKLRTNRRATPARKDVDEGFALPAAICVSAVNQSSRPRVHLDDAALALHCEGGLLDGFEERAGVGQAAEDELGVGVVVREDGDCADAEDAVEEGLVE